MRIAPRQERDMAQSMRPRAIRFGGRPPTPAIPEYPPTKSSMSSRGITDQSESLLN